MRNRDVARTIFIAVFALIVITVAYGISNRPLGTVDVVQNPAPDAPAQYAAGPAKTAAKLPKMIEIYAEWCPPCQRMKPILNELEKEYKGKVQFVRIDVDKNRDAAGKYKVKSIPVQLFYDKAGKQVHRHEGFYSKEQIKAQFNKMGIKPAK